MEMADHILEPLNHALNHLTKEISVMGGLVLTQLRRTTRLLQEECTLSISDLINYDREINQQQINLDALCNFIIARYQPTAVDLRLVIAAMRVVNDLERIGDQVKQVALQVNHYKGASPTVPPLSTAITPLAQSVLTSVEQAIASFLNRDLPLAITVVRHDEAVEPIFQQVVTELSQQMAEQPRRLSQLLDLMWCGYALERVSDYARSIAESSIYLSHGFEARHTTAAELSEALQINGS